MTLWSKLWAVWAGLVLLSFGVIEWLSIRTRNGKARLDTLTAHIQWLTGAKSGSPWRRQLAASLFVAAAAMLGFHFWA